MIEYRTFRGGTMANKYKPRVPSISSHLLSGSKKLKS